MFLEVKNISKKYEDKYAIKDVSFSLEKGKFLCLLGPSGSGKSTILHSIGGFIKHEGEIILDGKSIKNLSPEDRDVSTVFQSFGLFPHMNVLKNVMYGLKFKEGAPMDIYNHPKNEFTLDFIGNKNIIKGKYVRPEKIRPDANGEEFIINDITFNGETIELDIENDEHKLEMLILNDDVNYQVGEKIKVKYEMEDIDESTTRLDTASR